MFFSEKIVFFQLELFSEKIVFGRLELFRVLFGKKSFSFGCSSFRVLFGRLILFSRPFFGNGKKLSSDSTRGLSENKRLHFSLLFISPV